MPPNKSVSEKVVRMRAKEKSRRARANWPQGPKLKPSHEESKLGFSLPEQRAKLESKRPHLK
uniref:TPX2 C-terminal domain-containing protein n=1 Tax=Oryza rufipogon TaxID=4529 RepID=A0A0E0R731_ORYRU